MKIKEENGMKYFGGENGEWFAQYIEERGLWYEFDTKTMTYLPLIELDEEEEPDYRLTMWGHRRLKYLKENKPGTYQMLMIKGLWNHLVSTDKWANELEDKLMEQMSAAEGITEELKRKDAMLWVARRNGLKNRVREIVYNECIYV
ncbi:MAG: TnpV protein [Firmicutes bacterium]|nr:TnpV protein [Bacillota bacterium]